MKYSIRLIRTYDNNELINMATLKEIFDKLDIPPRERSGPPA